MISPEIVSFFEEVVEGFNAKQKIIAKDLIVDKTYEIIRIYENRIPKLVLRHIQSGGLVDFEKHVKSKCNC